MQKRLITSMPIVSTSLTIVFVNAAAAAWNSSCGVLPSASKAISAIATSSRYRYGMSTFHVSYGNKLHHRQRNACQLCGLDNFVNVLVRETGLLGNAGIAHGPHVNTAFFHFPEQLSAVHHVLGLRPAHSPAASVGR